MFEIIFLGLAMGGALALSVGPTFFALISLSLSKGFKQGLKFAIGISLADILIVIALMFFAEAINSYLERKEFYLIGGLFLILYGLFGIIQTPKQDEEIKINKNELFGGFLVNILNPGCYFLWLGFIAVCPDYNYLTLYLFVILLVNFGVDILKIYFASLLGKKVVIGSSKLISKIIPVTFLIVGLVLLYNFSK